MCKHHTALMIAQCCTVMLRSLQNTCCQCYQAQHFAALKIQNHFRARGDARNIAIHRLTVSYLSRHMRFAAFPWIHCSLCHFCSFFFILLGGGHSISLLCFVSVPFHLYSPPQDADYHNFRLQANTDVSKRFSSRGSSQPKLFEGEYRELDILQEEDSVEAIAMQAAAEMHPSEPVASE